MIVFRQVCPEFTTYRTTGVIGSLAEVFRGPIKERMASDLLAYSGYRSTPELRGTIASHVKFVAADDVGRVRIDTDRTDYDAIRQILTSPSDHGIPDGGLKTTFRTRWAELNSVERKFAWATFPGYVPVYFSSLPYIGERFVGLMDFLPPSVSMVVLFGAGLVGWMRVLATPFEKYFGVDVSKHFFKKMRGLSGNRPFLEAAPAAVPETVPAPAEEGPRLCYSPDRPLKNFTGYTDELTAIRQSYTDNTVTLIEGVRGAGKSSIASCFAAELKGRDVESFWFRDWDENSSPQKLMHAINSFLMERGNKKFKPIDEEPETPWRNKAAKLAEVLDEGSYALFLDNFQQYRGAQTPREILDFICILNERLRKTRILPISYEKISQAELPGVEFGKVTLDGVSKEQAREYLRRYNIEVDEETLQAFHAKTGGHPFAMLSFVSLVEDGIISMEKLVERFPQHARERINESVGQRVFNELREDERALLTRFSVFRGEVNREAFYHLFPDRAEVVVDRMVDSLIRKHFIVRKGGEDRYNIQHYLFREISQESLSYEDSILAHSRAAEYYRSLPKPEPRHIINEAEMSLYKEQRYHFVQARMYAEAADSIADIAGHMYYLGYWKDSEEIHRETIATMQGLRKGWALHYLGMIEQNHGNTDAAVTHLKESKRIAEVEAEADPISIEAKRLISSNIYQLGVYARCRGDFDEAERLITDSLTRAQELGDKKWIASSIYQLGVIYHHRSRRDNSADLRRSARTKFNDSLGRATEIGDQEWIASNIRHLGMLDYDEANYTEAQAKLEEALSIFKPLGHRKAIAWTLYDLAKVRAAKGEAGEARSNYQEALDIFTALNESEGIAAATSALAA